MFPGIMGTGGVQSEQRFQPGANLPPRHVWWFLETHLVGTAKGGREATGLLWVEVRGAAKHPIMLRRVSTTKTSPAQNVKLAEGETLWFIATVDISSHRLDVARNDTWLEAWLFIWVSPASCRTKTMHKSILLFALWLLPIVIFSFPLLFFCYWRKGEKKIK